MKITVESHPAHPMADKMDQEIMRLGKESNDMKEKAYETAAPSGTYTVMGLNSLVDALNTVLPMFGIPDYAKFTETMPSLPGQFVKMLTMVNDAATQAGVDEAVIEIGGLVDDKSLKMAAGKLMTLAANTAFKQFLRSSKPTMPEPEEEGMTPETKMKHEKTEGPGMNAEEYMMGRMS